MTKGSLLYLVSFGAHGVLALGVATLKGTRPSENVSVAVVETTKKTAPPPAPPPPPPSPKDEPRRAETKAKVAPPKPAAAAAEPPPAAAAAAPAAGDALPDFGLSMAGGTAGGGLAVPVGNGRSAPVASAPAPVAKKVLAPAPAADACSEPPVKAKALSLAQPTFTREAREANVSGKVRVEVTVDANGHVTAARVLEGLGYGLDEAALAAARAATFEASTRCGKPVSSTFVIGMRFSL